MKTYTKWLLIAVLAIFCVKNMSSQSVGINADGSAPNSSAILDVSSTTKGFLLPRVTTAQMNAISSPAQGLMVYNTSISSPCAYDGSNWVSLREGKSCGDLNYEGQVYTTVIIGAQCWMAQNLNVGTRINSSGGQTNNSTTEKYCYDDNVANCAVYGGLYQWDEMMQYTTTEGAQGICPTGWHLPSDNEWTTLISYLGGTSVAGGKMKETGTTHWNAPNTSATNSSGFTALPGGFLYSGIFWSKSGESYWWSSSRFVEYYPYSWSLSSSNAQVTQSWDVSEASSVRCLKD